MIKVEEIQKEINSLSTEEYKKLRDWIIEKEWGYWDKKIENDSESGKLDFLVEEALDEKFNERLKEL
ncbi:MAG: hypothetical protein K8R37_07615 [Bacteroidales bacterium]|nr:hypothetical protein [Bacteroidales bacterium]